MSAKRNDGNMSHGRPGYRRSQGPLDLKEIWEANYRWDEVFATRGPQRGAVTSIEAWREQNRRIAAARVDGLVERLGHPTTFTVLELGCGSCGPALTEVARRGMTAIGIDISDTALNLLQGRLEAEGLASRIQLKQGRVDRPLDIASESVDAVIGTALMCHVPDYEITLAEAMRVLRPGGVLHLDVWLNPRHPDHHFYRAVDWVKDRLASVIQEEPPRTPFYYHRQDTVQHALERVGFEAIELTVAREATGLLAQGWYPMRLTIPYTGRTREVHDTLSQSWPLSHLVYEWQTLARKPSSPPGE